jgi:UDP:flavonoid glycosyltransferase YjiC (YdhE family)
LNQAKLLLSPRLREFRIARFFEKMNGEFLGVLWTAADRILVPDLPPPYTVSEHNLWDISSITGKLEYVGFTSPVPHVTGEQITKVANALGFARTKPIIFVHISGPIQTRVPLIRTALQACKSLGSNIQFVISEGKPKGNPQPIRISETGWYYEWCPVRDEIFAMSDMLVLRAGHVTISQAIRFAKPFVTIPIENHGEQLGNADKISRIGLGIYLNPIKLRSQQIADAISTILKDSTYQKNAIRLSEFSEKLNGIDNIVNIVRTYLD